ncbi:YcxB family protein [Lachnoclostridium sp.]|uniref:YcxB family protein n=1 Tax=Lachnoclostridium sp. TaxID=2028282 RepID=UPI0028A09809|nr:YcxB family protein [Lachnoclostridium sp.]
MKRLQKLFVAIGVMFAIMLTQVVTVSAAQTMTFDDLYMTLEISDDFIVLTPDTPRNDGRWAEAGIIQIDSKLKEFNDMGVRAMFYDKKSNTSVTMMVKTSSKTREIVNFINMTDTELQEYFDTLVGKDSEKLVSTVEEYKHKQTPFFKLRIQSKEGESPVSEVIYGTIMNGKSFGFDVFKEGSYIQDEEEELVRSLVDKVSFTKILDASELSQVTEIGFKDFAAPVLFILIIVTIMIIFNKKNKKASQIKKKISQDMQEYRLNRKKLEEAGELTKEEVLFTNSTEYHDQAIKTYCMYNHFFKRIGFWIYVIVLYLIILGYSLFFTISTWITIIVTIAGVAYGYYQGIAVEKMSEAMKKRYENSRSKNAITKFYDDYFTVSGIQYISDFPYVQVTEVRKYKNYIYLYLGSEVAYFVDVTTFNKTEEEGFMIFLKQRMGEKLKFKTR